MLWRHDFLIDFGASNHMVESKESLSSLYLYRGPSIHMGDDSQIPALGKGSIKFEDGVFKNVLYVPSMVANMLFIYHIIHTDSPKWLTFDPDSMEIHEVSTGNAIEKGDANYSLKEYDFSHFIPNSCTSSLLIHSNDTSRIWHEIFGHLNFKYLQQLHNEDMVEGLPLIKSYEGVCNGFLVGKHLEQRY